MPLEAAAIPVPSGSEPEPQPGATVPVPAVDATADHQVEEPVQNPLVDRFTKMLHVGVPLMAVEQKMRAEGLDPALLRQPPPAAASRASSDRSLSDTDDESNPWCHFWTNTVQIYLHTQNKGIYAWDPSDRKLAAEWIEILLGPKLIFCAGATVYRNSISQY